MVISGAIPTPLEAVQAVARLALIGPVIGLALGALASYVRACVWACMWWCGHGQEQERLTRHSIYVHYIPPPIHTHIHNTNP